MDLFQPVFKKYKKRHPFPDLSNVIDFENKEYSTEEVERVSLKNPLLPQLEGLCPVKEWKAYTIRKHPGLYIITNPFVAGFEYYWVDKCLAEYSQKPNITNLDAHIERTENSSLWNDFAKEDRQELSKDDLLWKLRWTTLGYHYNWDTKEYSDKYTPFPPDLRFLATYIAAAAGYPEFSPEAGIINYYHMDSTLAGHTDHSEFATDAPLISVSFGQKAIFLLGGITKETEPSAVFLQHGDICILSGASRLAFHAVPKILPTSLRYIPTELDVVKETDHLSNESDHSLSLPKPQSSPYKEEQCLNTDAETSLEKINKNILKSVKELKKTPLDVYLTSSRINVNIRQVYKPHQILSIKS